MSFKQANIKVEIAAGITTFFTMVYVVIVNPSILATPGTGLPFSGVLTATVLLSFSMSLLMGVYANLPFAVGPGMGINVFFTYTILLRNQVPWPVGLGIIFWSGVLFLFCSLSPIRMKVARAIPENIRFASATGIGIFLTFMGLKNSGLIIADPVTLVRIGVFHKTSLYVLIGLVLMIVLLKRKNPFAFLLGIGSITAMGWLGGDVRLPNSWIAKPDFSVFMKLDPIGAFKISFFPVIFSIFFTDLFDSISTLMGCSYAAGLKDTKGEPLRLREGLIVDAWATLAAGLIGTSSGTAFIESAAGIEVGGRTGLTAVVTALCFLPCLFLAPIAKVVPPYATAPVLILVGALMFRSVKELQVSKFEELIPSFLTVVLIPLTFSITQGILWGMISHVLMFVAVGRRKEIGTTLFVLCGVSIGLLMIENFH